MTTHVSISRVPPPRRDAAGASNVTASPVGVRHIDDPHPVSVHAQTVFLDQVHPQTLIWDMFPVYEGSQRNHESNQKGKGPDVCRRKVRFHPRQEACFHPPFVHHMPYAYTCKKRGEHPTTKGRTMGSNERKSREGSSLKTEGPKMKETLTVVYNHKQIYSRVYWVILPTKNYRVNGRSR